MKPIRFIHGVGVALVLGFLGSAVFASLAFLLPSAVLIKLSIAILGLAYIGFLLVHAVERTGRLTAIAFWLTGALFAWFFAPTVLVYSLIHLGMLWLLRSLYFYTSALAATLDLGLNLVALGSAVWALQSTQSVFLGIWCFFLVQAVFPAIPATLQRDPRPQVIDQNHEFRRARRMAEAALRRISTS